MSSEDSTTAATAGSEAAAAALQQLIKSESSSDPGAGPPPGLIPLPGRDAVAAAEKQQVQAAMAMAAFYSQNPLWQAALARERIQQQQQQLGAAAAALSQLPGRPPPGLGALGLPGLAGLLAPAVTSSTAPTDLFRDYLSKLASTGSPTSLPQYLSSAAVSTSSLLNNTDSSDHIKTENPLPASLRPGRTSSSSTRRSTSPGSASNERNFLGRDGASFNPYFNLQRSLTTPATEAPKTINRSPPSGRGGRGGGSGGREKVFTCGICNRSFGYKHVLQNHERTHTGEKPFECKECHKRFTRDHHLKTHMRLHTGEKPYSCPHCDRQFVQVANLRRHVRVHTGERPYKCELCPSDFSDSNQLKAHMLMHKGKTGPSFNSLKEELLFRHQMAALPQALQALPQYPPPPALASLANPAQQLQQQQQQQQQASDLSGGQEESSHASLSPESKETGDTSPGHNETMSDSNSEKRRSRKQKPRKMIFGENEENTETEEDGSSSRDRSPRERHASSSSFTRDEGGEPEQGLDLSVRRDKDAGFLAYRASTAISELQTENSDYTATFNATKRSAKPARNRSEGSEGSLSASDPLSAHSTPNEKFRSGDDLEDDKDDDERGVSPPMSHPGMYNQLFGGPAAIQLGLSGAAVPLTREYMEKESELMAMVAQHKEISQQ